MRIRRVRKEDINKGLLETLKNLSIVGNLSPKRAERILKKILTSPFYKIFIAEKDGKIVGTITLLIEQKLIHGGGRVGHIEDVAVRKCFEKQGIGSALIKKAKKEARKSGCYKVILDCKKHNVSFYEKNGFRKHEISMGCDLK